MKIETKFSIGDSVWVMKDNSPYSFCIGRIYIETQKVPKWYYCDLKIKTTVSYSELFGQRYPESACYSTKEELLASL